MSPVHFGDKVVFKFYLEPTSELGKRFKLAQAWLEENPELIKNALKTASAAGRVSTKRYNAAFQEAFSPLVQKAITESKALEGIRLHNTPAINITFLHNDFCRRLREHFKPHMKRRQK